MKLTLFKKLEYPYDDCWNYIVFITRPFQFRWFLDCGDWFIYIHLGKKYWRFSSCGYLKGEIK